MAITYEFHCVTTKAPTLLFKPGVSAVRDRGAKLCPRLVCSAGAHPAVTGRGSLSTGFAVASNRQTRLGFVCFQVERLPRLVTVIVTSTWRDVKQVQNLDARDQCAQCSKYRM
jgi:hypothetical protein